MKHLLALTLSALTTLSATAGGADPVPAAGSEALCIGMQEQVEGVWLNDQGVATLAFRFASNENGAGCYAWLNAVPEWGIAGAGAFLMDHVIWEGEARIFGTTAKGVRVNLADGSASFYSEAGETKGRID